MKTDQIRNIAAKYETTLQTSFTDADILIEIKDLGERYEQLIKI